MCQISTNRLIVNCVCVRKCQSVRMTTCTFVPLSICPFIHLSACVSLCGHGQSVNRPFIYSIVESLKAFGYRAAKISRNQPNPPLLPFSGAYIHTYIHIYRHPVDIWVFSARLRTLFLFFCDGTFLFSWAFVVALYVSFFFIFIFFFIPLILFSALFTLVNWLD